MKPVIATLILLVNMAAFAQPENRHHDKKHPELTLEQKKSLRLKKLTLDLDLSNSQQKDMALLIDEQMTSGKAMMDEMKAKRESGQKPTADEIYAHKSQMLDQRIAINEKAKKILDKNQYETWKRLQDKAVRHNKETRKNHKQPKHEQE
ncbi:hypothetical protein [Flavobacterium silvaticum]|uniref:Periplasmic heavy metal sensor n=1 Tax=Flavobacterium silvaticum TaxID=1852020 RepID=A0A972JEC0_9FLAO|nr:hypothetical protein [Flavobacterium silvaticum]NMH26714.1 hypothetical protein [Flavobacterium silvaticum]